MLAHLTKDFEEELWIELGQQFLLFHDRTVLAAKCISTPKIGVVQVEAQDLDGRALHALLENIVRKFSALGIDPYERDFTPALRATPPNPPQ